MTKIIYVTSDYADSENFDYGTFNAVSDESKLDVARHTDGMRIYTPSTFEFLFNSNLISDLGYIFIVNDKR